ncbi:hypothetical protein O181_117744 [Austropuccinia psidii MF-1]|uniref:Uncharacterized protein n=1 Tax=Austropuccinia psidii MF-1 TaxID=1389203 RepID=A0A9Q3PXT2_9BASI|nr:hypothetical protein [Austropuccinia psidii MF-1]
MLTENFEEPLPTLEQLIFGEYFNNDQNPNKNLDTPQLQNLSLESPTFDNSQNIPGQNNSPGDICSLEYEDLSHIYSFVRDTQGLSPPSVISLDKDPIKNPTEQSKPLSKKSHIQNKPLKSILKKPTKFFDKKDKIKEENSNFIQNDKEDYQLQTIEFPRCRNKKKLGKTQEKGNFTLKNVKVDFEFTLSMEEFINKRIPMDQRRIKGELLSCLDKLLSKTNTKPRLKKRNKRAKYKFKSC